MELLQQLAQELQERNIGVCNAAQLVGKGEQVVLPSASREFLLEAIQQSERQGNVVLADVLQRDLEQRIIRCRRAFQQLPVNGLRSLQLFPGAAGICQHAQQLGVIGLFLCISQKFEYGRELFCLRVGLGERKLRSRVVPRQPVDLFQSLYCCGILSLLPQHLRCLLVGGGCQGRVAHLRG